MSVLGLFLVFGAELNPNAYRAGVDLTEQFQDIFVMVGAVRAARVILVIFLNTVGTLMLVGGAVYSAFIFWRKREMANRLWGNVLIAAGGLLPSMGGFLILLGSPDFKYLGQLLGGLLLFAGFLVSAREERPEGFLKRF